MMKPMIKFMDKINNLIFYLVAIIFGLVSLLTIYQVFARYILKNSLVWSEEIVRDLMIWIVVLGTAIALRKGLLISVETLVQILPNTVKKIVQCIIILINIVFLSILIRYGFDIMASLQGQNTGALDLPVSWMYASIPVGACFAVLNSIVVLLEIIFKLDKKEEEHGNSTIL